MRCDQPGCAGTVVDGYCDVCGSPGPVGGASAVATPTAAPVAPTSLPATPAGAPGSCTQPGCGGTVVDGYCDVCGTPGVAAASSAPATPTAIPTASARSARSVQSVTGATPLDSPEQTAATGSSRLDSTALGSARTRGGSAQTRRVHSGSQRLRSARLGAGLTRVPPAPTTDAAEAVMVDPVVPENKRSCPSCGAAVGRARDGKPGRTEGFCPRCRNPFSFTPKLRAGDLVANQYEVAGCLAHGGLGWIYLARDRNVSNRWVVLKGLLNTGDADALAVAIAEQQFLAAVEHPLIVEIYNFVTHEGAGYIVMEYVGGVSLKQILKARMQANHGLYDPLPVDQALAYVLEVLPAFSYLHDLGLVYCDFKPDNLIQVGDAVKLIDLGGVRRIDDNDSAIYGTVGYQAPEVATMGTTVASDIYTIGRTLLVLMMEFRGYQTSYVSSLPPVETTPLFSSYDSLYRLLAKCCAPDPADRFGSVDELRVQILGVLREVVAARQPGTALTSSASLLFEAPAVVTDALAWDQLPRLRTDTSDAQYAWLATLDLPEPQERWRALETAPESTPEVNLARGWAALQLQSHDRVDSVVNFMLANDPWEWRAVWLAGLGALQRGDLRSAQSSFNAVYGQVPGELAPKLALALACEQGGAPDVAEGLYRICASTDANYVPPAAFGLARIRAARHDVAGVVQALDLVPTTSRGYTESRRQRGQQLLETGDDVATMAEAMASVAQVRLDPVERAGFTAKVLARSLELLAAQPPAKGATVTIGSYPSEPDALRDGLEATYRELARAADTETEKIDLVDRANAVRRWTWQ